MSEPTATTLDIDLAPEPRVFPSTPRNVKLRGSPWGTIFILVLMASVGIAFIFVGTNTLVLEATSRWVGITTEGSVTGKETRGRKKRDHVLHFRYKVDDVEHVSVMSVDELTFDTIKLDERVHVRVWPAAPVWSAWIDEPHVRASWNRAMVPVFSVFWFAVLALIVHTIVGEDRRRRRLTSAGVPTHGHIADKQIYRGKSTVYRLTYRYRTPTAPSARPEREATMDVAREQYEGINIGTPITVLYDPDKPDSSLIYAFGDYRIEGM